MLCKFDNCKKKKALIGYCNYCEKNYCLLHRLPEGHNCKKQDKCNDNAKKLLVNKLYNEKIKPVKI